MKTILIIGGTGFFGHSILKFFSNSNSLKKEFRKIIIVSRKKLQKYDYWALAHLLYRLKFGHMALDYLIGRKNTDEFSLRLTSIRRGFPEEYIEIMKSCDNYTKNPNTPKSRVKRAAELVGFSRREKIFEKYLLYPDIDTKYTYVYNNIKTLDAELSDAGCWTFTDLMNASKVYSPDDTSNPLKWPLEDKNVTDK